MKLQHARRVQVNAPDRRAAVSPRVDSAGRAPYFWACRPTMTSTQPLLFTVAFRRKMTELSQRERQEWLVSLAKQLRSLGESSPPETSSGRNRASLLRQELREVARGCRLPLVDGIEHQLGPFDPRHLSAVLDVPRERFVRAEDVERSAEDTPLMLDEEGLATISAPHAYLLSFRLLALEPADVVIELGSGAGYGAALASFVVGPEGSVRTFEIDEYLAAWATRMLASDPGVDVVHSDAMTSAPHWGAAKKIVATFAVTDLPVAWVDALPEGGRLVAPVGPRDRDQQLVLAMRKNGRIVESVHGAVRYVKNRSAK